MSAGLMLFGPWCALEPVGTRTMTKAGPERRKHQRLPLSIPVFVRGVDQDGKEFLEFATALNISAGGVLLATRRSLPRSTSLALEIPVAPLPPNSISPQSVRSLKAKLVRITHGERCHLLGLKFYRPLHETAKGKIASA
ncbi:MAG: PilZ domain-containing protein [Terriglobales bacterium]